MATTLAEKLASVQAAIAAIEGGAQSITSNGQTLTRADLGTLYAREEKLLKKVDWGNRGRTTVAEF